MNEIKIIVKKFEAKGYNKIKSIYETKESYIAILDNPVYVILGKESNLFEERYFYQDMHNKIKKLIDEGKLIYGYGAVYDEDDSLETEDFEDMKNLFDYAPKELSQDAFLCWLFDNFENNYIGPIAKKLLTEMINLDSDNDIRPEDIDNIVSHSQSEHIDVVVDFKINGEPCLVAIEDKVSSKEHSDQLKKYKNIVEKWNRLKEDYKERKCFLVYYKTGPISDDERQRIVDSGWKEYTFERIDAFWSKYLSSTNLIIYQYANHVHKLWCDLTYLQRPDTNNLYQWTSYYEKVIVPALEKEIGDKCDLTVSTTRYGYVNLKAFPKNKKDLRYPYMEIRSRDCLDNNLVSKILVYEVETDSNGVAKGFDELREEVRTREYKGIFKANRSNKYKKQVGRTPIKSKRFIVNCDNDFIKLALESINEYLDIVKCWNYGK